jgi:hypothetical protein
MKASRIVDQIVPWLVLVQLEHGHASEVDGYVSLGRRRQPELPPSRYNLNGMGTDTGCRRSIMRLAAVMIRHAIVHGRRATK